MSKSYMIALVLALSLQAGTILPDQGIGGLVEPGEHSNMLLPPNLKNETGITLQELLEQNPQNLFAFTSENLSGPRNLVGVFAQQPWKAEIWTTPNLFRLLKEEPNFERFQQPVVLPIVPPVEPPVIHPPSCVGCEPVHPPGCMPDCHHHHHPVLPEEPHHPGHEVPEPKQLFFVIIGLILIYLWQPKKHHRG